MLWCFAQLLAYKRGEFSPAAVLVKVKAPHTQNAAHVAGMAEPAQELAMQVEPPIRELVVHMTAVDPGTQNLRRGFAKLLEPVAGVTTFLPFLRAAADGQMSRGATVSWRIPANVGPSSFSRLL